MLDKINGLYMSGLQRCYRKGLVGDATLAGSVPIASPSTDAGVVDESGATGVSAEVDACICRQMTSWRFAIPKDKDGDADRRDASRSCSRCSRADRPHARPARRGPACPIMKRMGFRLLPLLGLMVLLAIARERRGQAALAGAAAAAGDAQADDPGRGRGRRRADLLRDLRHGRAGDPAPRRPRQLRSLGESGARARDKFQVIAIDSRGQGRSTLHAGRSSATTTMASDVLAVMD